MKLLRCFDVRFKTRNAGSVGDIGTDGCFEIYVPWALIGAGALSEDVIVLEEPSLMFSGDWGRGYFPGEVFSNIQWGLGPRIFRGDVRRINNKV